MNNVLLIDFGSTYTKITAVDVEEEAVLGTARGITTVESDIMIGLQQALDELFAVTGRLKFAKVLACSSAAGGLRMVAIGLIPELTVEAAKRAALGAGAKLIGVYGNELSDYEVEEIAALQPEIILLAGGTDGGNKEVILHNGKMLTRLGQDIPIIVAGNKSVVPQVIKILSEVMTEVVHTENVMPHLNELNIEPAREAIRGLFLRRIVEAKGLNKANEFVDRMVMPTPAAVLKAAELLGKGTNLEVGVGDLMVIDIGGATTDVYSIGKGQPHNRNVAVKGLPEPFAKRTVEGDLGMRYSAAALFKAAGTPKIAGYGEVAESDAEVYMEKVEENIEYLPQSDRESKVEIAMARACACLGVERHVGQLETVFTLQGQVFVQKGKDLTAVKIVVGTGGVIVNHQSPGKILEGALYDEGTPEILKPQSPEFWIDEKYIMSAMGLLGEEYPDVAVRMMKKYIVRR